MDGDIFQIFHYAEVVDTEGVVTIKGECLSEILKL